MPIISWAQAKRLVISFLTKSSSPSQWRLTSRSINYTTVQYSALYWCAVHYNTIQCGSVYVAMLVCLSVFCLRPRHYITAWYGDFWSKSVILKCWSKKNFFLWWCNLGFKSSLLVVFVLLDVHSVCAIVCIFWRSLVWWRWGSSSSLAFFPSPSSLLSSFSSTSIFRPFFLFFFYTDVTIPTRREVEMSLVCRIKKI